MKIVNAKIDWKEKFVNDPLLVVFVQDLPDKENFLFEEKIIDENLTLYFSEFEGIVRFFLYNKKNKSGYGGATFEISLKNREIVEIVGPWSSRSGVMNLHFKHSIEVIIVDNKNSYGPNLGHITIELAQNIIDEFIPGIKLEKLHGEKELSYSLVIDKDNLPNEYMIKTISKSGGKYIEIPVKKLAE